MVTFTELYNSADLGGSSNDLDECYLKTEVEKGFIGIVKSYDWVVPDGYWYCEIMNRFYFFIG